MIGAAIATYLTYLLYMLMMRNEAIKADSDVKKLVPKLLYIIIGTKLIYFLIIFSFYFIWKS